MKKTYIIPKTKCVDLELDGILLNDSFVGGAGTGGIDTSDEGGNVEEVRDNNIIWRNKW